jgi:predicted nucleotidyltransferase
VEDEFLRRSEQVNVGGTVVPVIHPEDLIIAKVLAGRPKDIEDARVRMAPATPARRA